jgi:hypothetical protein
MLDRVSKENFQIVYDGEALSSGYMDVYELAPALLSVGDLVKSANSLLNGKESSASVLVESDFKRGSFEISLLLDQVPVVATALPGQEAIGAAGLVSLIFGTLKHKEIIESLLDLWKKLKGEKPKEIIRNHSTGLTMIVTGNDNKISVSPELGRLYEDDKTRQSTAKILSPVGRTGISGFEARQNNQVLTRVEKADLPEWIRDDRDLVPEMQVAEAAVERNTRDTMLTIVRPNFDKKGQWGFAEGSAKFSAKMEDREFLNRVQNREISFQSGDVFRVRLRTEQLIEADGKLRTSHIIEEILQHTPKRPNSQLQLKQPEDRKTPKGDQKFLPPSRE